LFCFVFEFNEIRVLIKCSILHGFKNQSLFQSKAIKKQYQR